MMWSSGIYVEAGKRRAWRGYAEAIEPDINFKQAVIILYLLSGIIGQARAGPEACMAQTVSLIKARFQPLS